MSSTASANSAAAGTHRDFLVEIGTEELPPLALPELERSFAAGIAAGLNEAGLPHALVESFATPRRLAVRVAQLATEQPSQEIKLRGPPVSAAFDAEGNAKPAAVKFAEKCGVTVAALARVTEGKGEFLFYAGSKPGVLTHELLPLIVQRALAALPIPKRMRWGSSDAEFVRPVHWLLMLFGAEVIEANLLDTLAGNSTRGHRFHAPGSITIERPADYERQLRERGQVIADFAARRARIRQQVVAAGDAIGGETLVDDALLEEVTALVEWPVAVAGQFEARFLKLPREVLISTLQDHQRYFPVLDSAGSLLPWFITVSNIESRDPSQVRAGNERVVRPRLSDAAFFWEQDRNEPLAGRRAALDNVTYQAKLGSIGARTERVAVLAVEIARLIDADPVQTARAAMLAKCDLLSAMVGEFPELQGVMGHYLATADGEGSDVAAAIEEHYLPRGAGTALPSSKVGTALALADKLDTLAGIFAIGQKPSGTRDPFGLRRAAIGVIRILVEKQLDLDLGALTARAVALQPVENPAAASEVADYIVERLRAYFLDNKLPAREPGDSAVAAPTLIAGATTEMFDAVHAAAPRSPLDFGIRLAALARFLQRPEAESLAAANKRIANILKKSAATAATAVDTGALQEPAEKSLHAAMLKVRDPVATAVREQRYADALETLATLRPEVDSFFDGVMVNAPDPVVRANRLALLRELRDMFAAIADLSRLPG
ncbi:MAG: glycine--tRNA ligase subunit beta [Pseudomonadales bacterium]|nr:glycine--tRNA ligase subunit beta [Pseudomonadales bacterium]